MNSNFVYLLENIIYCYCYNLNFIFAIEIELQICGFLNFNLNLDLVKWNIIYICLVLLAGWFTLFPRIQSF